MELLAIVLSVPRFILSLKKPMCSLFVKIIKSAFGVARYCTTLQHFSRNPYGTYNYLKNISETSKQRPFVGKLVEGPCSVYIFQLVIGPGYTL